MSSMIAQGEIRDRITAELAMLRDLCRALVTVARMVELGATRRESMREVLEQVCTAVEEHFRYEEAVIAPLLREVDPWGPVRVERLLQDHAEQLGVLLALAQDAREDLRNEDDLVDEVVLFFQRFEQEISDQEMRLLSTESLGAEPTVDQIDG
jgi:hypothetical protein